MKIKYLATIASVIFAVGPTKAHDIKIPTAELLAESVEASFVADEEPWVGVAQKDGTARLHIEGAHPERNQANWKQSSQGVLRGSPAYSASPLTDWRPHEEIFEEELIVGGIEAAASRAYNQIVNVYRMDATDPNVVPKAKVWTEYRATPGHGPEKVWVRFEVRYRLAPYLLYQCDVHSHDHDHHQSVQSHNEALHGSVHCHRKRSATTEPNF